VSDNDTLRSRAVAKAVQVLGGEEALAARLGLTPGTIKLLMAGRVPVPQQVFLKVVDIISGDDWPPNGNSKQHKSRR
jgi:DNA-binding transcriptional regulator YdaS (Cro superfamily)